MPATIKLGSVGPDVRTWQLLLGNSGFPIAVNSSFDASTDQYTRAWQKAKGLGVDGVVGPASWAAMTGKAPPANSNTFEAHRFGRQALLEAWPKVTGKSPTLAELQIAGAMAMLESNYGRASYRLLDHATGAVLASSGVINNWGAVQTDSAADGFLATDTSPLKVTADNPHGYYDHHYKRYASPADGAAHLVSHLAVKRPTSWARAQLGDIDGFSEAAHAAPGKKDPVTGTFGYFEQAPSQRALGLAKHVNDIAAAMGEPVAAQRGGPVTPGSLMSSQLGVVPKAGGVLALLALAAAAAAWVWGKL